MVKRVWTFTPTIQFRFTILNTNFAMSTHKSLFKLYNKEDHIFHILLRSLMSALHSHCRQVFLFRKFFVELNLFSSLTQANEKVKLTETTTSR